MEDILFKNLIRTIKMFNGDYKSFQKKYKSSIKYYKANVDVQNWVYDDRIIKNKIFLILADYYWNYVVLKNTPFYNESLCKTIRKGLYGKKCSEFLKKTDDYFNNIPQLLIYFNNLIKN